MNKKVAYGLSIGTEIDDPLNSVWPWFCVILPNSVDPVTSKCSQFRLVLSATKNVTQKNLLFGDILRD